MIEFFYAKTWRRISLEIDPEWNIIVDSRLSALQWRTWKSFTLGSETNYAFFFFDGGAINALCLPLCLASVWWSLRDLLPESDGRCLCRECQEEGACQSPTFATMLSWKKYPSLKCITKFMKVPGNICQKSQYSRLIDHSHSRVFTICPKTSRISS